MEGHDAGSTPGPAAAWHRDPQGRFEYRYFNGVQWTSDVAVNGQRFVDSAMGSPPPAQRPGRPPRGMAIAAFVTAAAALTLGWVPFVFAIAAPAAIAAIVFGVIGVRTAQRHGGYGRGFAVAGLAIAPFALAACVGGFFFTRALVHELREFVDAGPHRLFVEQPCTIANGQATVHGTIANLDDRDHDYRLVIQFHGSSDTRVATVAVGDVAPGDTAPWTASVPLQGTVVTCEVTDVFGPVPFDVDNGT